LARLAPLTPDQMSPEQKQLHDRIKGARPRLGGPFSIWIRNPDLAAAAQSLVDAIRANGKLDKRLYELTTLIVTRHWTAQYAYNVHEPLAVSAGIDAEVAAAIRTRKTPAFKRDDEKLVYDVVTELQEKKALSPATYDRAVKGLGVDLLIELIAVVGVYAMVSMTLVSFEVDPPEGSKLLS
jgi:4-carboxymuconolactone decarboxylase